MLIKKASDIRYSEVTPKHLFMNRRKFLTGTAAAVGGIALAGRWISRGLDPQPARAAGAKLTVVTKSPFSTTENVTSYQDVTTYNNYYEFGTDKEEPAKYANTLRTSPWTVEVGGLVDKPKTFDLDAVMKMAPLEERIYRHRCVERWSIVVPWIGFPLSALLKQVEPNSKAKYVAFQSIYDTKQMPRSRYAGIPLPYVEGLRMDEAMHPLALLTFGLYGETLPNQDGAPIRMVVPWKYGFKSIKSIVKITLVERQPPTTWNIAIANEYGFYSNVNPEVDHPRWSQGTERRLGELFMRKTVKFNGYGDQVASLYTGMDLRKNY